MPGTRILVVEDEREISEQIAHRFEAEGWDVLCAGDGLSAVDMAAEFRPDAIVLDVMLPGIDGLEVCRRVQAQRNVPVLMLTARDDETDLLVGLGVGADDYMTKPFSMRELVARVKAVLRRYERAGKAGEEETTSSHGDLVIDREGRRVAWAGTDVHLTPTEFDLLVHLVDNEGRVLSREHLLEHVWSWADSSATRTVDSHVKALRRKLRPEIIRTVHGVGYAFDTP